MALERDLELLMMTLQSPNLRSRRYERNIENAVRRCLNRAPARRNVLDFWAQAWKVSYETFVLLACTFGHDSLTRRTRCLPELLSKLKELEFQALIQRHPVLTEWANRLHKQGRVFSVILERSTAYEIEGFQVLRSLSTPTAHYGGVDCSRSNAQAIVDQLRNEPAFSRHLPDGLPSFDLSLVSMPDPEVQRFCDNSGIQMPRIVPADGVWGENGTPTFHQMFSHVWSAPRKGMDLRVFQQGESSEQPSTVAALALSQLVHPDARNPVSIIGIDFPDLLPRWKFGSCAELHRHVTTALDRNPVINVTPQYTYVDLHIDYGMDGKSAVLGDCQKTIVLFPPSFSNLRLMRQERGNRIRLARLMCQLEFGLIDKLTSSNVIFIPSGWVHATFTTRGGFLVSIDCATKTTIWTFSQYLKHDLHRELDNKQQIECLFLFLDCLEHALTYHEVALASRSWCDVEDQFICITDAQWKRRASQIWHQAIDDNPSALLDDGRGHDQIPVHQFCEQHLSWLDDQMIGMRRGRRLA